MEEEDGALATEGKVWKMQRISPVLTVPQDSSCVSLMRPKWGKTSPG